MFIVEAFFFKSSACSARNTRRQSRRRNRSKTRSMERGLYRDLASKARFPWSVFWSGFGADFVRALSSPGKAWRGQGPYKVGAETAPKHAPWKTGFRHALRCACVLASSFVILSHAFSDTSFARMHIQSYCRNAVSAAVSNSSNLIRFQRNLYFLRDNNYYWRYISSLATPSSNAALGFSKLCRLSTDLHLCLVHVVGCSKESPSVPP